jgi:hypothetical protein
LLLWFTIFPVTVGWPPVELAAHDVIVTSFFAAVFDADEQPASAATAHVDVATNTNRRLMFPLSNAVDSTVRLSLPERRRKAN